MQISQARGDTRSGALARGGLGLLAFEEGGLERALRYLEEQASWLRVQGRANALIPTLVDIAAVWRCLGRVDRALEAIGEADDVARFANLPYLRALAGIGRAAVSLAVGDLEGATRILGRARVAIDPEGPAGARLAFREVQGQLRLARGDQQAALAAYQAAEAEAERAGHDTRRAFFLGMTGVLTADGTALTSAMEVLGLAGERRLAARLLLHGALTGGDAEVLCSAESEASESGDRFLLLEVLHASGSQEALAEASRLADTLLPFVPADLRAAFLASPSVYWTGIAGRQRALDPGPVGR